MTKAMYCVNGCRIKKKKGVTKTKVVDDHYRICPGKKSRTHIVRQSTEAVVEADVTVVVVEDDDVRDYEDDDVSDYQEEDEELIKKRKDRKLTKKVWGKTLKVVERTKPKQAVKKDFVGDADVLIKGKGTSKNLKM